MGQTTTKPASTGNADEERSVVARWLRGVLGQTEAPPTPEPDPEPKPDIAAMVAAEVRKLGAEQAVATDLAKLEGKATPAAINAIKPALLSAKAEGRDGDYAAMLTAMGASDASALLGGEIADDKQAGSALAPVGGLSRADVEALNGHGITPERAAHLVKKHGLSDYIKRQTAAN